MVSFGAMVMRGTILTVTPVGTFACCGKKAKEDEFESKDPTGRTNLMGVHDKVPREVVAITSIFVSLERTPKLGEIMPSDSEI